MTFEHSLQVDAQPDAKPSALAAWVRKRRWFVLVVIVPTLLAALYYGFVASDVYISESRFVIKSPGQKRTQSSTLASLIQTTGLSTGQEQTNEVLGYVHSRDALKALVRDVAFKSKFASDQIDFASRYPKPLQDDSFEGLYKYYGKMVEGRLDSDSGLAVIKVKAFRPEDAYQINRRLLDLSESLVNRLNGRAQNKGIAEAQKQVELATTRALNARVALSRFRNSQQIIDPSQQAVGVLDISNGLVAQRAALMAQLDQIQRVAPNNPSIPALQNRVSAISVQIASQESRVVGTSDGIASKLGGYENLAVEQEFATQNLNVAQAALVQARAEAQQQQFYLERVVDPNLPDSPLLPSRFINVLTVAAAALCLYFIGWMLLVGILEHSPDE